MQYVENGFRKLFFGFRQVPHITQIQMKYVLLGTFGVKSKCVEIFFCFKWHFYVFSKAFAQIFSHFLPSLPTPKYKPTLLV
jgi:hypothetical protein